jgi:hypothetical protein
MKKELAFIVGIIGALGNCPAYAADPNDNLNNRVAAGMACEQSSTYLGYGSYDACVDGVYQALQSGMAPGDISDGISLGGPWSDCIPTRIETPGKC